MQSLSANVGVGGNRAAADKAAGGKERGEDTRAAVLPGMGCYHGVSGEYCCTHIRVDRDNVKPLLLDSRAFCYHPCLRDQGSCDRRIFGNVVSVS